MEPIPREIGTLRSRSIGRIVIDMIRDTKKMAGDSSFLIIIVDDQSAKILSSFITMSELLNEGVFSVERLHTKRQPFPKYHSLYFISPTSDSCEKIVEDFKNESRPMYSRIHIFFTHRIMDITLEKVVVPGVVKRLLTCKELNLSFLIRDKNLYDLGFENGLGIFSAKKDEQSAYLSLLMERLFTVCTVLKEYPHVQYQKSSALCTRLAEMLNAELRSFNPGKGSNDRRGVILITDRTFDPTTPFLHDYNWETMVYDMFPMNKNELDFNQKKYKLDDSDELWSEYKNMHMAKVFEKLPKDFEDFMKSDVSKVGKGENLESFDEMTDALKNIKEYKTKTTLFGLHLKLAEEVSNRYNQLGLFEIIELEQDIVTGISSNGDVVGNKDIFKNFNNLKKTITNQNDLLRLLCTIHTCLDINEKDYNNLLGDTLNTNDKKVISNLEYLGISFAKSKGKSARRDSSLNKKEKLKEMKLKLKNKFDYNTLRSSPKIEGLVELCSRYELTKNDFPFVEDPKNLPTSNVKRYATTNALIGDDDDNDNEDLPVLIVFIIGGISHNEISSLERLVIDRKVNHRLIVGSTEIITAFDYIDQLRNLGAQGTIPMIPVNAESRSLTQEPMQPHDIELGFK